MNHFFNIFLIIVGILFCVGAFVLPNNSWLSLPLLGKMIKINHFQLCLLSSMSFLIIGIGYLILEKLGFEINRFLKWTSISLFLVSVAAIWIFYNRNAAFFLPRRYYRFDNFDVFTHGGDLKKSLEITFLILFSCFIISWVISLVNWIRAVFTN